MSYYDVLGIPSDAGEEAIRRAFRVLARRYHPDAGEGSSAERFRQIVEAYETLSDPARRRLYDISRRPVPWRAVQAEPTVARPEPLVPETRTRTTVSLRYMCPTAWDDLFDEIVRSLDELFGPPRFRW